MSQSQPHRLYSRGTITGYRRGGPSNGSHKNHITLMSIEGVNSKEETDFYAGKRVAYIYKVCVCVCVFVIVGRVACVMCVCIFVSVCVSLCVAGGVSLL